jgi:hypothetical protein
MLACWFMMTGFVLRSASRSRSRSRQATCGPPVHTPGNGGVAGDWRANNHSHPLSNVSIHGGVRARRQPRSFLQSTSCSSVNTRRLVRRVAVVHGFFQSIDRCRSCDSADESTIYQSVMIIVVAPLFVLALTIAALQPSLVLVIGCTNAVAIGQGGVPKWLCQRTATILHHLFQPHAPLCRCVAAVFVILAGRLRRWHA